LTDCCGNKLVLFAAYWFYTLIIDDHRTGTATAVVFDTSIIIYRSNDFTVARTIFTLDYFWGFIRFGVVFKHYIAMAVAGMIKYKRIDLVVGIEVRNIFDCIQLFPGYGTVKKIPCIFFDFRSVMYAGQFVFLVARYDNEKT
jgi:hypothetical protein